MEHAKAARIFKAIGDENRLRILSLLRSGERCACKLLEDMHISQSTLSHHMKLLCDAELVYGRKEGKWVYYSIVPAALVEIQKMLSAIFLTEEEAACCSE